LLAAAVRTSAAVLLLYTCTHSITILQDVDHQDQGYMVKSGIVVICRNAVIKDGTVI
jgi:hypothetical protein